MRFYRCKCGDHTAWSSMGVSACLTCKKCGSDLAEGPSGHADEPTPHDYVTKYNQDTGAPYERCQRCWQTRAEIEAPPEPEPPPPPPPDPYELFVKALGVRPWHCDSLVLHPPGTCEGCDSPQYEPLHQYRREHNINHTGESDPNKAPCPAERRRSADTIHRWPGNRPRTKSA